MRFDDDMIEALELLSKNEEAMSKLYRLCADKFPQMREFWSALSRDELDHADWIQRLSANIDEGTVSFNKGRFKNEYIQMVINGVEEGIVKIQTEKLTLLDTLSLALYFEQSLMDRKFFEVFVTDNSELKNTLLDLKKAVTEHRERIEKRLQEEKQKNK